jgi:hypothetical protein
MLAPDRVRAHNTGCRRLLDTNSINTNSDAVKRDDDKRPTCKLQLQVDTYMYIVVMHTDVVQTDTQVKQGHTCSHAKGGRIPGCKYS